ERGAVSPEMPAYMGFNHVIPAIELPDGLKDPSVVATLQHPKLGTLLYFDPTDEITPFGRISGTMQENYGLLVAPDGGELLEPPRRPATMDRIRRKAKLTLDANGTLK